MRSLYADSELLWWIGLWGFELGWGGWLPQLITLLAFGISLNWHIRAQQSGW